MKRHKEAPNLKQITKFINIIHDFINKNPDLIIGVHCTHGFNRTGFLICCYLVEKLNFKIRDALLLFSKSRPCGIYKQDYVVALYKRYARSEIPIKTFLPNWKFKSNQLDYLDRYDDQQRESNLEQEQVAMEQQTIESPAIPVFVNNYVFSNPNIESIVLCDQNEKDSVIKEITKFNQSKYKYGFPGTQPVSMDQQNVNFLLEKNYMVTPKVDGTRYLMYISDSGGVYMINRSKLVFRVEGLIFVQAINLDLHLNSTLVDGVST